MRANRWSRVVIACTALLAAVGPAAVSTVAAGAVGPRNSVVTVSNPNASRVSAAAHTPVPAATTVTLTSSNPSVYNGRPGAIVAKVRSTTAHPGVPTGSVDFYLDPYDPNAPTSPYLTEALDPSGTARLDFSQLFGPGDYQVTALYTGAPGFGPAVSAVLPQTVRSSAPLVSASFAPPSATVGLATRLTISARNPTPFAMHNVALGVSLAGARPESITAPRGALCSARPGLYYCLVKLPARATRSLVLKLRPAVAGEVTASAYARNNDTDDETSTTATLTVV